MGARNVLVAVAFACAGSPPPLIAQELNGFDLRGSAVPADQIHPGGPPRDGIPAIDRPQFVPAASAGFLADADGVLGIVLGGAARAYPIGILNWHEVVNDRIGERPVVITYCPLCGTGVAFDARVDGRALSFGVSGLLYNSDVLLYDRQTRSLWSQLLEKAISGPMRGRALATIPLTHTTWGDWRKAHPDTRVLSRDTGYARAYDRDPYAGYESDLRTLFPVQFRSEGFHPKERVLGVRIGGQAKAYPFVELGKTSGVVSDRVGGSALTIRFERAASRATAHTADGKQIPAVVGYWFAWYAFNPTTAVFRAAAPPKPRPATGAPEERSR
ncbi:MAG: hypothetical protein OHK0026_02760 [Rhodocyclaceae bacterium]